MACPKCHLFSGSPCNSCRTLARIQHLLESGRLLATQESAVLGALRSASGALTDLAEEALPILRAEKATSDVSVPEESTVDDKKEAAKVPEPPAGAPKTSEAAKKEVKPGKKKDPTKKKEKKVKKEQPRLKSASPTNREPASSWREDPNRHDGSIDEHVARNPGDFGLGIVPRGSLGSHFASKERGSERPPEPPHPPSALPRRDTRARAPTRDRSRSKRRGTKGKKHRYRGRFNWPPYR